MQKLTGMEWLKKHIAKLEVTNSDFKDKIEKIKNIDPEIYNEFQPWTPLKLVLLNYALDTCTIIIRKKSFFKQRYCVDLFAGSSINRIKDSEDFLIGSPLISSLNYGNDFTKMFFCENKPEFFNSLEKRLASLSMENIVILGEDCNILLDKIMEIVNKPNVYSFFFIDPYNNEFCWESMKKVLRVTNKGIVGRDILFTFMTSEIMRAVGLAKSGRGEGTKLTQFFGDESWKKISEEDYVNNLVNLYKMPCGMILYIEYSFS